MTEQLCDVANTCSKTRLFDKIEEDIKSVHPGFNRLSCTEAIAQAREVGCETVCGLDALSAMLNTVIEADGGVL